MPIIEDDHEVVEQQITPRTKEQLLEAVRGWAAEKGLDEEETSLIERIATLTPQKKIATELNVTVYRVQKNVQALREKLGWSQRFDMMRMGFYLAMALSESPKLRRDAEWLYGHYTRKEGEPA